MGYPLEHGGSMGLLTGQSTRRRALIVTLVTLCLGSYLVTTTGTTPRASAAEVDVAWNVLCGIDHFGTDDPIVFPNQTGMSHMHSFYGNKSTNARTTPASLKASPSSCGRGMGASDRSAYWIPSVEKKNADGTVSILKDPDARLTVYYRRAGGATGPKVTPFPQGFRMIAGDAHAKTPQPSSVVSWDCGDGGPEFPNIPTCRGGADQPMVGFVTFPSCWDGHSLDSTNHKSHVAYPSSKGKCPTTHPVSLPRIDMEIWFPNTAGGPSYFLSSGGVYSLHADFFAMWDNRVQNALVTTCLNQAHGCSGINRDGNKLWIAEGGPTAPITIDLNNFSSTFPSKTPAPQRK